MAKGLMHYACYLFVLTICIDFGDGRWKKKELENLEHDIDIIKKITEAIEHEIEVFYEDYSDENFKKDRKVKQNLDQNRLDSRNDKRDENKGHEETMTKLNYTLPDKILSNNIQDQSIGKNNKGKEASNPNQSRKSNTNNSINEGVSSISKWPKFEDLLLAMGKKYDWKNDRWVKVKGKLKGAQNDVKKVGDSFSLHEMHKFRYRTVKLNRNKSRRNIVIAVSAVR